MLTLGIPTLNRYDLLDQLIASAERGSLVPDRYVIIDNGGGYANPSEKVSVIQPGTNLGVANSWNELINLTSDIRLICNDDLEFYPTTLEALVDAYQDDRVMYPHSAGLLNAFSCFTLPGQVVGKVGWFDPNISPFYAYFEDNDYAYRMLLLGVPLQPVYNCNLIHRGSQTVKNYTPEQLEDHHRRFRLAEENYIKKWGGKPHHEIYLRPYNR